MSVNYSDDFKNLVITQPYREPLVVPLEVVDFFRESRLFSADIENLSRYRRLTLMGAVDGVPVEPEELSFEELVGVDLTGKYVEYFHANYEDSEWLSTEDATGVAVDGDSYRLVFGEYEEILRRLDEEDLDSETANKLYDELPYGVDQLSNFRFSPGSRLTVVTLP